MFIGHFATALAAKRLAPKTSLATLCIAAQLPDLLWPVFLLLGVEHVRIEPGITKFTPLDFYDYPITHSLVGSALWGIGLGLLYFAFRRNKISALVVGACVFSHWILDLIVHRPDLPLLFTEGPKFGFGLWNSILGTFAIEMILFVLGVLVYHKATQPKAPAGKYGFWAFVFLLVLIWIGNFAGPPPPNILALALVGNAQWLLVLWAYWFDKHRAPVAHS